jgi:iron(III) transport system permease protein
MNETEFSGGVGTSSEPEPNAAAEKLMLFGADDGHPRDNHRYGFRLRADRVYMPHKAFQDNRDYPHHYTAVILSLSMIFCSGGTAITNKLLGIEDSNVYGNHSLVWCRQFRFSIAYLTQTGTLAKLNPAVRTPRSPGRFAWTDLPHRHPGPLSVPGILSSFLLVIIQSMEFQQTGVISGISRPSRSRIQDDHGQCTNAGRVFDALMLLAPTLIAYVLQKYCLSASLLYGDGQADYIAPASRDPKLMCRSSRLHAGFAHESFSSYGTVHVGAFVKIWGINFSFHWAHFNTYDARLEHLCATRLFLSLASTRSPALHVMIIVFQVVRKEFPAIGRWISSPC